MKNIIKINFSIALLTLCFWIIVLFVGCDKEVSRSPVESDPPEGFIYINSLPDRFTIFLNERNTGRLTPDSISYIEAGVYEITLKKKYFKDTALVVTLAENEKLHVSIDIASNPSMYGNLSLQTSPAGAEIIINDSATGKITPSTFFSLFPGEYRVKFKLLNHRDEEISTIVQSSKTNSYSEELRDTSVWVDYQVFNSEIASNNLTAITIDQNNVKWIGSIDIGLIKFDGVNFINYNTGNSQIPGNRINCLNVDNQNRIWVGTDKGIGIFDGSSWNIFNSSNSGLTNNNINKIRFYNNNIVWIATPSNLVKFDGINWIVYKQQEGKNWINDFYIETENKLYLGTKLDGIFIFENQSFSWMRWWNYIYCTMTVSSIEKDMSDELWFCFQPDTIGRSGISRWDGNTFTNIHLGTFQNYVNHIFIDNQNNKWISTSDGLLKYDNQNISTFYNTLNSLISSNNLKASIVDQNGIVWITTFASGLNKFKTPP
ncbi:MAG: PEGA domain-containing protein [Ignavibacteriaceae bacterium]|nr:PEGA domain-containing protein [Ignavibacteriaceae bacterium]